MDSRASSTFTPSRRWRIAVGLFIAAAFLVVDRITKVAILDSLVRGAFQMPLLPGIIRLQFVANIGAAFSIGEGAGPVFISLALVVSAAICWYLLTSPVLSRLEVVGMAMVLGGALGNALDRLMYGFVVDFFATEFIDFPVFNVADIGITVGVVLAFIGFLFLSPASHDTDGGTR